MDELWVRVGLIAGMLATVGAFSLARMRGGRSGARSVSPGTLGPGIYLFTSESCPGCVQARAKLDSSVGSSGYQEVVWDVDPLSFEDVGVDAVPAVLIVDESGQGILYPGQPDRALQGL